MTQSIAAYPQKSAGAYDPLLEYEVPERGNHNTAQQTVHAKLPCFLPLPCARIYARHQEYDVERGERVEYLAGVSLVPASDPFLRTLSEKFHVCQTSLVAEEVNMSR